MKIYCSRDRVHNNEAFFDKLIGKDLWVLVKSNISLGDNEWVRILKKNHTQDGVDYSVNWVSAHYTTPEGVFPCTNFSKTQALTEEFRMTLDVVPVEPVEMKTSNEFFQLLNPDGTLQDILCSSHSTSDIEFLDRCAGKDIYVLVEIDGDMDPYWIKIDDMTDTFYVCDLIWVSRNHIFDYINRYNWTVSKHRIEVLQPRETLTWDELFDAMCEYSKEEEESI